MFTLPRSHLWIGTASAPPIGRARYPNSRRGWLARVLLFTMVWVVGAEAPDNIIRRLNDAVVDALADPEIHSRVADVGQEIYPRERQTPEALAALHRAEIDKWWPIIKEANIKGE